MSRNSQQSNIITEEEDDEPLPRPVVTLAILAVIWVLFFAMARASAWHVDGFSNAVADLFGDKVNDRIILNHRLLQWWRLITPIFLHGGLVHILVNSYSLYILGRQIEPFYGSRRYFILFMMSGIAGVVASCIFSKMPSLGASGALFGLVGAGIVFPIRFRSLIPPDQGKLIVKQLVQVAVLNLGLGFAFHAYVDNSAHIGGLVGGGICALFMVPDALNTRQQRKTGDAFALASALALVALSIIAATMQLRWAVGPWWKITIPAGFRASEPTTQFGGKWKSPDGSIIEISDDWHNRNLQGEAVNMLLRSDAPLNLRTFGGAATRVHLLQFGKEIIELYLVKCPYDGRLLIVTTYTTVDLYQVKKLQYAKAMQSLRFLHPPPPDLHPVPLAVRVNSAQPAATRQK